MVTVHTVFSVEPIEVDDDEARSLQRSGLIRAVPVVQQAVPQPVTVTPVFTGRPVQVDSDEAASLARAGLLVPPDPVPVDEESDDSTSGQPADLDRKSTQDNEENAR